MHQEAIKQALLGYFQQKMPEATALAITDFVQHTVGWSDESFTFQLHWEKGGRKHQHGYAVRKGKKGGLMSEEHRLDRQFYLLDALSRHSDLPVARVYWYEADESVLGGNFFIMDRLPGKSYVPWSKEGRDFFAALH